MCGIAGIMLAGGPTASARQAVERMAASLAHRGPDGAGQCWAGTVGLAHARLAIIDLATGDQPFFAGDAALIGNGEIYNYRELKAAMPQAAFATASDCEVPLHAWLRDGAEYARVLRGMYALAIHDRATDTLTLSRDRFGIKPLYVAQSAAGLAFASEPRAFLAAGLIAPAVRPQALHELLQLQFTVGRQTIYPGIDRVLPGETLTCAQGRIVHRRRIAALPAGPPEPITPAQALQRLDQALMQSVELHQRSDVPYGMFLSGGIDSAAVLAAMARLNQGRVLAYTAGFDHPAAADERAAASITARAAGARHETIEITEAMVWRDLPRIVAALDDPACDYAIIPSWFLARRARQDVKVVLCGEGGDEIFAGYGRYRRALRPRWLGGRTMRARGTFDRLGVLRQPADGWRDGFAATQIAAAAGRGRLGAAQAADFADWLPHDLLLKLDRCLMAHGVEGRTPLLDAAVVEAGFRLPDALKLRDGRGKYLLRAWLDGALPQARPFAPKQGFTVPIGAWIAARGPRLAALVAATPGVAAIARPESVRHVFARAAHKAEGFAAWTLLFYALWHRIHIEQRSCEADMVAVLAG